MTFGLLAKVVLSMGLVLASASALLGREKRPVEGNPFEQWTAKTIMMISPHPDDDIIGCGGALAFLSGRRNHLIVIFLTAGEKGTFDPSMNAESIRKIRMQEAAAAYQALGFSNAELIWLHYGDGELDFAPPRAVRMRLTHLIRKHRPDIVFSLDPGGTYYRYHYRDHRSAALMVADAIGAAMWPLEYPERGVSAFKVPEVFYFYTAEPNLKLDISEVYERKLDALARHRSQFPPANQHYRPQGPSPSRPDLQATITRLTGATSTELFRRR